MRRIRHRPKTPRPLHWRTTLACLLAAPLLIAAADEPQQRQPQTPAEWVGTIQQIERHLSDMPDDTSARQSLAIAHNNCAVALLNEGHLSDAKLHLQESLRIDPSNAHARANFVMLNIRAAQAADAAGQSQVARAVLRDALALDPQSVPAYVLLGQIEYNTQRLKEAKAAWSKALTLDPSLTDVAKRLQQLNQELPVESKFERMSQGSFDIRYADGLDLPAGFDLRDVLTRARREIGSDFALWSRRKIVVLVYSADQFRQLRQDTPDWVAGQYDGKIRFPLPGAGINQATAEHVLFHEYTHAVIHELTDNRCPTWLNEGFADYEAWKHDQHPWASLRRAAAANALIPWGELSTHFSTTASAQDVSLAYEESHSIVRYLVERYGMWHMRRVLKAASDKAPLDKVWDSELHIKASRLEENWRTWLDEQLGSG